MKNALAIALIAAVGFVALAPNQASAVDGTINVTGTINSSTCKINGGNSPATVNVTLPTVSTTSLTAAGQTAGRTAFNLALSGCGALTKAQTYFEPGPTIMAEFSGSPFGVWPTTPAKKYAFASRASVAATSRKRGSSS